MAYPSVEPLDSLAHLDSDAIARHNATVNAFLSAHEDGANAVLHSQFPLGDHGLIVATRLVTEEGQMRVVRLRYGADQSARDRTLRWSLPNQGVVTEWTVGLHSGDGFTAVENIAKQTAPLVIRWRASSVNWKLFPVGPPRSTR